MNRKTCFAAGALLLAVLCPSPTLAGIEPAPFDILILNRSDLVAPDAPQYMQIMYAPKVYVEVQAAGTAASQVIEVDLGLKGIGPGQSAALQIDLTQAGGSITGWGFTARMGIEPMPFMPVFAMEGPTADRPLTQPILPVSLLVGSNLYSFASPATLIGSVVMSVADFSAYCSPTDAWRNHGQYVRCVSFRVADLTALAELTENEADEVVSAAARSQIGK